jgi:hypothetical protein
MALINFNGMDSFSKSFGESENASFKIYFEKWLPILLTGFKRGCGGPPGYTIPGGHTATGEDMVVLYVVPDEHQNG